MNPPTRKPFWQSRKLAAFVSGAVMLITSNPPPFTWQTKMGLVSLAVAYIFAEAWEGAANAQTPNINAGGDVSVTTGDTQEGSITP